MALTDEAINTLLKTITNMYESGLTESVLKRLDSFGYEPTEADAYCIVFSIQKVEQNIQNSCNIYSVPEGLKCTAVDMACGEILGTLYNMGKLDIDSLDLDGAIASISAGDIDVSFSAGESDVERFNTFISALKSSGRGELACYRKMVW